MPNSLGVQHSCSYYLGDFNALGNGNWNGHYILYHYCNSFASCSHFSVCVHYPQSHDDKWGPSHPLTACVITCMLLPRSKFLIWPCIILDEKASISYLFGCFDCFIQIGGITHCRSSSITCDGNLCSMTCQQPGYPQSIQRS